MRMDADDRVLVGVIRRKRDVQIAASERWYRIPYAWMPDGIDVEVLAFFHAGAVRWYALMRGVELAYRRDLLPDEPDHPRAGEMYYRVALGGWIERTPPIPNDGRRFAFIRTTWDRFAAAQSIADLTRSSGGFVNRAEVALGGRRNFDLSRFPLARLPKLNEWY
ncbi:MAG: hypothetical protein CUN53_02770 [Phototrophicales bacterium]|nr:MAG: hypothetical protein CUN53_02770 [Phototrophicales bacterium]